MRMYGSSVISPHRGTIEDTTRCIAGVFYSSLTGEIFNCGFRQCSHKRGKGPYKQYCGIHANVLARGGHVYVPMDVVDK